MITSFNGLTTIHSNLKTDIRIAREAGYMAIEITEAKLLRYLNLGFDIDEITKLCEKYSIRPTCINSVKDIEVIEKESKKRLFEKIERLCKVAEVLNCPTIQIVAFCALEDRPWNEIIKLTSRNISEIADIGKTYGIRFQIEPISWSPINSISSLLYLIEKTERNNVGISIDFWQLYAGEKTTIKEIADLDKSKIYAVHFSDGIRYKKGTKLIETDLRGFMLGEGEINIKEWAEAVKNTGFDGVYSPEIYSPRHWEWDLLEVAIESRERMEKYLYSNN